MARVSSAEQPPELVKRWRIPMPILPESWALPSLLVVVFASAVISAIVPWVNAELLLLAALPLAATHHAMWPLVAVVTAGQMAGKSLVYWVSRRSVDRPSVRATSMTESWRARVLSHPRTAMAMIGVSAIVGVPPFYAMSILAGATRLSFTVFLAVGGLGRLAHSALLAAIPRQMFSL